MKYKGIVSLIFCVSLTTTVLAQSGDEEIGGVGDFCQLLTSYEERGSYRRSDIRGEDRPSS
jgi:hypothetical protein